MYRSHVVGKANPTAHGVPPSERAATIFAALIGVAAVALLVLTFVVSGFSFEPETIIPSLLFSLLAAAYIAWFFFGRRVRSGAYTEPDAMTARVALLVGAEVDNITVLNPLGEILVGGHAFGLVLAGVAAAPGTEAMSGSPSPTKRSDGSDERQQGLRSDAPADQRNRHRFVDRFAKVHPADRDGLYAWLAALQSQSNSRDDHTYRVKADNGSWTELLVTGVNLDEDPTVGGLVLVSRTFDEVVSENEEIGIHALAHDVLTGLPNRRWLLSELERLVPAAAAADKTTGILFLDLDRFKVVNDSLGSEYGDALLNVVARQIRQSVRPKDIVARVGADEFVVLCCDLDMPDEAEGLGHRLLRVLAEPIPVLDRPITTSVSIGLAFADGSQAPETVLRDADIAMVRAKEAGGGRMEVFDDVLRQRVTKRLNTEQELRRALRNDELHLLFQPIVSLTDGLVAAEALVRWNHPTRGLLGPGEFIDVADETGLILGLGDWVLAEGCRTLRRWQDEMGDRAPNLTVNLSMRQIVEPSFVSRVRLHLAESAIEPSHLILEVTEDSLVNELDRCVPVLSELAALGLGIAIDDFGTGLSSLSYVKRLPMARTLKIDRSFVTDIHEYRTDHAIVQAVLVMAERLGIRVVAEGVETKDQLSALVELGCKFLQGYFFSPPLEADAILTFDPELVRIHGRTLGVGGMTGEPERHLP